MTTIAWKRNESISSDSQATINDTAGLKNTKKIFELKNGMIVGFAGDLCDAMQFVRILDKVECVDDLYDEENDFDLSFAINAIVIHADKTYSFCSTDNGLKYFEILDDFYAIGSGRDFALAAMQLKRNTKIAVKIAIELDIFSGGKINTIELKKGN